MSTKIFPIVVILFLVLGAVGYLKTRPQLLPIKPVQPSPNLSLPPSGRKVSLSGKLTCLLHRDKTRPQTLECAIGFQSTDGRYFGVPNLNEFIPSPGERVDEQITITGSVSNPDPTFYNKYDIIGTIYIESLSDDSTGAGIVRPEDPAQFGLAQVPDLPFSGSLNVPLTVTFVIEHRSALNEKTIRVKGQVKGALLGKDACPGTTKEGIGVGMCGQPTVTLSDPENQDYRYVLPVTVGEDDGYDLYPIGGMVEITGTVNGNNLAVIMFKPE